MMKAIIVTAGNFSLEALSGRKYDLLIGVDGGCDYLAQYHYIPDVIIGDFDSIDKEVMTLFLEKKVKVLKYKAEKDMTDTHIAIEYAIKEGADELLLLGATGTRLDHTLANIFLLERYSKVVGCKMIDHNNEITFISNGESVELTQKHYQYVSLLPISNQVCGVVTKGLKYSLKGATLKRSDSFGISNELVQDTGSVQIEEGVLAIIQSKD
jgi:thiamine pyrophosphokinase